MFENELMIISFRESENLYVVQNKIDGSYKSYAYPESILENHSKMMNKQERRPFEDACLCQMNRFDYDNPFSFSEDKDIKNSISKNGSISCKKI
jgi:hypothetical protein